MAIEAGKLFGKYSDPMWECMQVVSALKALKVWGSEQGGHSSYYDAVSQDSNVQKVRFIITLYFMIIMRSSQTT
jgi:hypothetical protein